MDNVLPPPPLLLPPSYIPPPLTNLLPEFVNTMMLDEPVELPPLPTEKVKEENNNLEDLSAHEKDKLRKRNYYHAHRRKIELAQKKNKEKKNIDVCKAKKVPEILASNIVFYRKTPYKKDRVALKFESVHDMLTFLYMFKFEYDLTPETLEWYRSQHEYVD